MPEFIAQDSSHAFGMTGGAFGMTDYFVISTAWRNLALRLRFLLEFIPSEAEGVGMTIRHRRICP